MDNNSENNYNIIPITFSKFIPDIKVTLGRKWTMNGNDNSIFKMYKDAYDDSPTNAGIINTYNNFVYAEGLIDKNGEIIVDGEGNEALNTFKSNISKHISSRDVIQCVSDYNIYGQFAIQVIWNSATRIEDKKPVLLKWLSIQKVAVNVDINTMEVDAYWYSYDWTNKGRFVPKLYQKFDGNYKGEVIDGKIVGEDVEIYVVRNISTDEFFARPDWFSGLRYAMNEGELANYQLNTLKNGFQGGKIINFNNGELRTDEQRKKAIEDFKSKTVGTDNAQRNVFAFNKGKDSEVTIVDLLPPSMNTLYEYLATEAEMKIIVAHQVPPILVQGLKTSNGLGNNADEIENATKLVYQKVINPKRNIILDGFQYVFDFINPSIKLAFKDFKEFNAPTTTAENINMSSDFQFKKWSSNVKSSNVDRIMYQDETNEMVLKFNDGSYYQYDNVDFNLFKDILNGNAVCKTDGENEYGSWYVGKTPSIGAAVFELLQNTPYKEVGRVKMSKTKLVSFNFDKTANTEKGKQLIKDEIRKGNSVYLISDQANSDSLIKFAKESGIRLNRVYATGSNSSKEQKIKELGIDIHYDNNKDVIDTLGSIGKLFKQ